MRNGATIADKMEPYWADKRYIEGVSSPMSVCHGVFDTGASLPPLLMLGLSHENSTTHLASPPGFISTDTISQLRKQVDSVLAADKALNITSMFLQYQGDESVHEVQEDLSDQLDKKLFKCESKTLVHISLSDDDTIQIDFRKDTRSRIRQILKNSWTFTLEYHDDFHKYYSEIAKRNCFSSAYCYSNEDLSLLNSAAGIFNVSVFTEHGEYVGGAVLGHVNQHRCDYILSAYSHSIKNAGRAILWYSLIAAREMGYASINLGGGVTEDDALFRFKSSFGGHPKTIMTIKSVVNENLYRTSFAKQNKLDLSGRFPR